MHASLAAALVRRLVNRLGTQALLAPTAVPVPGTVCYVNDRSVLGAEFYVMDLVDGIVYRTAEEMAALSPAQGRALGYAFIDCMADLHQVDYMAAGLADFGRPDGYLERQVRRWTRQLAASRSRDIPGFDQLGARLAACTPSSALASIVHGDFRLDNAIVDPADPSRVLAILDWEMATLGDPLSDLGRFYLYWEGWGGLDNPDTGNMELLTMFGTDEQKQLSLAPLLDGTIRSAFCMTEPGVASSDAANISLQITPDGKGFVVNGEPPG